MTLQTATLAASSEWGQPQPEWTLVRVVQGDGYLLKSGEAAQFGAGDALLLPPGRPAVIRASALGPVMIRFFHAQPQLLGGLLTLNEIQRYEDLRAGGEPRIFSASAGLAQKIAAIPPGDWRDSPLDRCRRLRWWLEAMAESHASLALPAPVAETDALRERFRRLLERISAEELCGRSPRELASELNCSARHFYRLFREEFGLPLRHYQADLRLARARQLLLESNAKIINVAQQSGYNHLGLFNQMFKKRFGMTPGDWRLQARKKPVRTAGIAKPKFSRHLFGLIGMLLALLSQTLMAQSNPPPGRAAGPATNATAPLKFEVRHYVVEGNTVVDPHLVDSLFAPATGTSVSFQEINQSVKALQKEYLDRGLVTVLVTLPQQKLTNATIKIKVVESPLSAVNVVGNRYFSSNSILAKLPSLRTNALLNSFVLQRELDAANASRDRQIYSILGPGPEPDTSALTLRVKDQLPLHARVEVDNYNTPGSPALRANFNAQYDNLWNLDHQIGIQYGFTPEFMKYHSEDEHVFLDSPEIANYSAYYRVPIGRQKAVQNEIDANPAQFGYNEATHQFQAPAVASAPELTFYASRATTDSGVQYGPLTAVVTNNPLLSINSQTSGENTTVNNNLGSRFVLPIDLAASLKLSLNCGLDFKEFHMGSFNTNNFLEAVTFTNSSGSVTSNFLVSAGQPARNVSVHYLPLNTGFNLSRPDKWGASFFDFSANFNVLPVASGDADFAGAAYSPEARADYVALKLNYNREQKLHGDWSALFRAGGQWSPHALISNEQYPLGGMSSVRGYHEGEVYGDSGWAVSLEPRTPFFDVAEIGEEGHPAHCLVRFSAFFDYGQAYLSNAAPGTTDHFDLCGAGAGGTLNIGEHLGAQVMFAVPMISTAVTHAGSPRVEFSLSAQF